MISIILYMSYIVLELLNIIEAYVAILNARLRKRKRHIVVPIVVICIIQVISAYAGGDNLRDEINIIFGLFVILACLEKENRKLIWYYPIIILGIEIINASTSYIIALILHFTVKKVVASDILNIFSMMGTTVALIIYRQHMKRKNVQDSPTIVSKKNYSILLIGVLCCSVNVGATQFMAMDGDISVRGKLVCGLAVSIVSIVFLVMSIWQGIILVREREYEQRTMEYEYYLSIKEEHIKRLIEKDQQLRRFRHDLNAHITVLRALSEENKILELKNYINKIEYCSGVNSIGKYSGITAIDALLNELFMKAKKKEIVIEWSGTYFDRRNLSVFDLCTIFFNTVSNAIEACERITDHQEKIVKISVKTFNDNLYINIKNTCLEENELKNIKDGRSYKADNRNHGFGIQNVKDTVKKYEGTISYTYESGWMEMQILI